MIALLLLLQGALPTVGDTVWVRRVVAAPPGRAVRAAEWTPTGDVEVLGRAQVTLRGDSAEVSYPVVLWSPGPHALDVPGPLLVGGDGQVDSLPAEHLTLTAASVLPASVPRDSLQPQPATPPVALREVSLKPLLALWALTLVLFAPVHLWWRRRGKPTPVGPVGPADVAEPDMARWADAGEPRAVVGLAVERLRATIAARLPDAGPELDTEACLARVAHDRPAWPVSSLGTLLRALDAARFAPAAESDAVELYQQACALERELAAAP